jgi:acyl carrier protein
MMSDESLQAMRKKVTRLVCVAAGGSVTESDLEQADGVLKDVGLTSISYMNLFEAIERSFGVVIDPEEDPKYLASVDSILKFLVEQLEPTP